ncbi:hypothetical protein AB0D08_07365 [Kitasatospora sp. NPDC048540]|uniref:hypothetical protein n=1 Tax=Kitasatospora sp. NPDC048540 TaxID=3155634 RepID=UPI0033CFB0FF
MTDGHGRLPGADPTNGQPGEGTPLECELRLLLHRAVADVEPDAAALRRIRIGVPRRRVRYRNTWTGAAAAVLMAAAAVPAIQGVGPLGLSGGAGGDTVRTPVHTGAAPTGAGTAQHPVSSVRPSDSNAAAGVPSDSGTAAPSQAATAGPGTQPAPAPAPWCTAADLGSPESRVEAPDAAGKVYGWFALRNTSTGSCRVADDGRLTVSAAVGGDPAGVKVVPHRAGDAATALPAPPATPAELLLTPGAWYRVRFGWVPGESCTSPGGGPSGQAVPAMVPARFVEVASAAPGGADPVPGSSPSPTDQSTPAPTPSPSPTVADHSLTLAYAPRADGQPVATAVLKGACGGAVHQALPEPGGTAAQPSPPPGG